MGGSIQLSVSGGSEGSSYYLSGNWNRDEGIFQGTDYERAGVRARLSQRLSSLWEVGANLSFLRSRTNYVPEGEQTQGVLPTVLFTPPYFNPAFDANSGRFPYSPVIGTNPLDVIENWEASSEVNRFLGSAQATFTPLEGLGFTYLFGLDQSQEEDVYFQPPASTSTGFTGSI